MRTDTEFFTLVTVDSMGDAANFASFLLNAGRANQKVALYVNTGNASPLTLYCATPTEVWQIPLDGGLVEYACMAGFRHQVLEVPNVTFVMRDIYFDLPAVVEFLHVPMDITPEEFMSKILPLIDGDLNVAAQAIGWPAVPHSAFEDGAMDAYGTVTQEEQFSVGAPVYYKRGGLPMAKLQTEGMYNSSKTEWVVAYDDLWIRVAAHYTGDPTIRWAFEQERNPWAALSKTLDTTVDTAKALLIWHIHGRNLRLLQRDMPDVVDMLPDDLPSWGVRLDRSLPAFCAGISGLQTAYWNNRGAQSLYGRLLRPGKEPGEASAWQIFGAVDDIIVNAAVTLWQNRPSPDIYINSIRGGPTDDTIRIGGELPASGKEQWEYIVKQLAPAVAKLNSGPLRPSYLEV